MNKPKKLCVIASYDSFIKASIPVIRTFKKNGCTVEIFIKKFKNYEKYLNLFDQEVNLIESLTDNQFIKSSFSSDYLMISLSGGSIDYILRKMNKYKFNSRPLVFAGYCGLVYEKFKTGVFSRSNLDVYFVNSKKDFSHFQNIMEECKRSSNIYLTGLPLFDNYSNIKISDNKDKDGVVFAAQPTVPSTYQDRKELIFSFINLAKQFPNQKFYFKTRGTPNEKTFHKEVHYYQNIILEYPEVLPENFKITQENITSLFEKSSTCLSVSSTALIEAHLMGLKVGVITDFGVSESLGNNFFNNSGVQTNFQRLSEGFDHLNINSKWLDHNLEITGKNAERLYKIVEKKADEVKHLPFRSYKPNLFKKFIQKLKRLLSFVPAFKAIPH